MAIRELNQPLGGNQMPRFGGPATFSYAPSKCTHFKYNMCIVSNRDIFKCPFNKCRHTRIHISCNRDDIDFLH